MMRLLPLLAVAAVAACSAFESTPRRAETSVEAACRGEAERVMLERSRANRDRLDDFENRLGTRSFEAQQIRATEILDRDRIYRECLGRASPGQAPASQPAPSAPVDVRR